MEMKNFLKEKTTYVMVTIKMHRIALYKKERSFIIYFIAHSKFVAREKIKQIGNKFLFFVECIKMKEILQKNL